MKKNSISIYKKVKPLSEEEFIEFFKVLGDKVRHLVCKQIFVQPGITGKEILSKFHISQPTLSFHIAQLVRANIVIDKRQGQSHTYYPNIEKIAAFHKTIVFNHMSMNDEVWDVYKSAFSHLTQKNNR